MEGEGKLDGDGEEMVGGDSWHMAWRRMAWFCYVSVYHHCLYKVEKEWAGGHCRSSVFDSQAHGRREKGKESEGFTHSRPAGVPLELKVLKSNIKISKHQMSKPARSGEWIEVGNLLDWRRMRW